MNIYPYGAELHQLQCIIVVSTSFFLKKRDIQHEKGFNNVSAISLQKIIKLLFVYLHDLSLYTHLLWTGPGIGS